MHKILLMVAPATALLLTVSACAKPEAASNTAVVDAAVGDDPSTTAGNAATTDDIGNENDASRTDPATLNAGEPIGNTP